jgi:hypothetical protein
MRRINRGAALCVTYDLLEATAVVNAHDRRRGPSKAAPVE